MFMNLLPVIANILPPAASSFAGPVDFVFWLVTWICLISFLFVEGALIYFVFKYRRRRGEPDKKTPNLTHSTKLEIVWTLIPAAVMMVIFYFGVVSFVQMRRIPKDAMQIAISAKQWAWQFTYDNGVTGSTQSTCEDIAIKNPTDCKKADKKWQEGDLLRVPAGEAIKLKMTSTDVLHSFYVPAFRVKQDVVPGMYNYLWFRATKIRKEPYVIYCTEYCGLDHSGMSGKVLVMQPADFNAWYEKAGKTAKGPARKLSKEERIVIGQKLFAKKGCATCHSLEGEKKIAPPLNGLIGRKEKMANGKTITINEEYIRESIKDPAAKVVAGFQPMAPQQVSDDEVESLIEYFRTLE